MYFPSDDTDDPEEEHTDSPKPTESDGVIKTAEVDKVIDKMNQLNEMFGMVLIHKGF